MIEEIIDENNIVLFKIGLRGSTQRYEVIWTPDEEVQQKRQEYEKENKVQREFLKFLAKSGEMDGIFSKSVIKMAAQRGARPRGYQIHHIIPLCCGGTNDFDNLMLVHKNVHAEIHDRIWAGVYQLLSYQKGEKATMEVPCLPRVMIPEDQIMLLTLNEVRRLLSAQKCKRKKADYLNGKNVGGYRITHQSRKVAFKDNCYTRK
ncbi:MAG: HNH endonuclease [Alphaproteobacteria bacterium]|nr:HNH endonuclease [Alphaproteobacteria bacterium]